MPRELRAAVIGLIVVSIYIAFVWSLVRWMRSRLHKRALGAVGPLEKAGARIIATRPPAGYRQPAEIEFEMRGSTARFQVRQYGRDFVLQSVRLPSQPLPAILVRAERGIDRLGKSLGLNREVQLGDAAFDAAAYIESSANDDVVRRAFESPDVRARTLEVLKMGYSLDLSSEGIGASQLRGYYASFESPELPALLTALEGIRNGLPDLASSAAPRRRQWSPVVLGSLAAVFLAVFALPMIPFVHPPMADGDSMTAFGYGLIGWLVVVAALFALLRGRSGGIQELLISSMFLVFAVPTLTGVALMAMNSGLDGGPTTSHRVTITRLGRKDHEVYFDSWRPGHTHDKVGVPFSVFRTLSVGDTIDVTTRPGALGWMWAPDVRRVDQP